MRLRATAVTLSHADSSPQAGGATGFRRANAAIKVAVGWETMAADSLELPEPGVGDDGSQHRREIAEAAEGMVDGSREVLVPFQVGEEVERQHR